MIIMLLMAGGIVNGVLCAIAGGVVLVGLVFFLIGLPEAKSSKTSGGVIRFTSTVFSTLLTLIVFMVITYWNARNGASLAFTSSDQADAYLNQAKNLVILGAVQGAFSLLAFLWILPRFIGHLGLGTKHKWGLAAGAVLTIAGGGAAWLSTIF
ncbi:hypothetical protein [Paenibacillus lactis]|uniref:Yip1 domain-containing protein n=1 Tax=Paenibacillus lactis 154 TaxID=743719 RepID=G4HL52_9BACL|nr:hypothetical protein [Paenibacillus lactis]EHB57506.1 hypothetical protein PaelaDRAFT_4713 [Paenibacillus lactis 154]